MKVVLRFTSLACLMLVIMSGLTEVKAQVTNGRIAFVRGSDIYVSDSSGVGAVNLTNNSANNSSPVWSPDGSKIAFVSFRNGNNEIFVMNQNGTNPTRLTTNTVSDTDPSFSPDGTKILFVSTRDGNNEIYTMNVDGTNPVRLTNYARSDTQPKFSPDSSKIVFVRENVDSQGITNYSIFRMNADGSNVIQLTTDVNDSSPSFSPDGNRILFQIFDNASFLSKFITINPDGSNLNVIYAPSSNFPVIHQPSFSPDGSQVIYYEQHQINPTGYRIRFLGSISSINDATNPAWQPVRPVVLH
jgi:Tol biopolymer transport system component